MHFLCLCLDVECCPSLVELEISSFGIRSSSNARRLSVNCVVAVFSRFLREVNDVLQARYREEEEIGIFFFVIYWNIFFLPLLYIFFRSFSFFFFWLFVEQF